MRTNFSRAGMLAAAMAAGLCVLGTAGAASAAEWYWDGYRWRYAEGDYGYSKRDQAYLRELRERERAERRWERNQWNEQWDEQRGRAYRERIDTGCRKYC